MIGEYAVFFDLDDTLYDRSDPFRRAFRQYFPEKAELDRTAYLSCDRRGNEVFLPSQRGEITMEEMYIYRYRKGFGDIGIGITDREALEFQEVYRSCQKKIKPGEGVPELLDFCRERFRMTGILTNGPADKQQGKIDALGLSRWVPAELTIISGAVKVDKPDPAIFHLAEQLADLGPDRMIYVGDSLFNDIRPAAALGWKTVYLDRKGEMPEPELKPDLVLEEGEILTPEHLRRLF